MLGLMLRKDDMEVYVDIGLHIGEPKLYLKENGQMTLITSSSLEYENDDGEFMLNLNVPEMALEKAMAVMHELADSDSIELFKENKWIKFHLTKEYMKILDNHFAAERTERTRNLAGNLHSNEDSVYN